MNAETINSVIDNIAAKLNVAAEKVYPMLYKQALIEGYLKAFWIAVFVVGIVLILKYYLGLPKYFVTTKSTKYPNHNVDWEEHFENPINCIKIAVFIIFIIVGVIMIPLELQNAVSALFNTDWYIFDYIIKTLK